MALSVFDVFSIGIGPSSSHTVGPMRAAARFVDELEDELGGELDAVTGLTVQLFGSLGATGRGHACDTAVLMGLLGERPDTVDPAALTDRLARIRSERRLPLGGRHEIDFDPETDVVFELRQLPAHPNAMTLTAKGSDGAELASRTYYSVGGGRVADESSARADMVPDPTVVPHPFHTGADLMAACAESGLSIAELMAANEEVRRSAAETREGLLRIRQVMAECIERGIATTGVLPGGLEVPRRAPEIAAQLAADTDGSDPLRGMDWVAMWALAVNEENAAGGRVVTAPTNGAAGIVPAVLTYYDRFVPGADEDGIVKFLLVAGAIGIIVKETASISGAEVGCQGEVGTACSMAAAGLAAVLGGTNAQIENAAEIGMEHNLGLTCDPIGGLVQVPCIERNAIAAVKAIAAARTALRGDGVHLVSLDDVVRTMRDTGRDMQAKYKETALGGLAVNVTEC
ncbi:L-serine ammonia-lyase [Enemella sp. A6]|uniref:L-serine ammonia-lyase n=1 Tax=Enemella sp. A6 TaxID=3440152 RepID=UPI003EBA3F01